MHTNKLRTRSHGHYVREYHCFSVRSMLALMDIGLIAVCVGVALDHDVGSGAARDTCK